MPISGQTQPAQGYYQPSYVAPPVQQLAQIGERIQQEQQAQRQAAQQFATQMEGVQVGADAPKAQQKIQQMKEKLNKAAKEVGYNLRSPEFRSKFQNIKSETSSDPFWTTAPQKAKEAQQVREKLQKNRYNLPAYVVNRAEEELARYQQHGSIDPETGDPIQFSGVPEEVPDITNYIQETLLSDVTEEDMRGFKQGIPQNKVAQALGITIGEDEEGNTEYTVNRIPLDGPEDRALSEEAEYRARQYARRTGEDLTREDVQKFKNRLWLDKALTPLITKSGGTTDWSAASQYAKTRMDAMQAGNRSSAIQAEALDFGSLLFGPPEGAEREGEERGVASVNTRAINNLLGIGEDGQIRIDEHTRRLGESRGEDILITNPSAIGAEDFRKNVDQIADYNRYKDNRRKFTDISKKGALDLTKQSTSGEGMFGTHREPSKEYEKLAETYAYTTGNNLQEDYPNLLERIAKESDDLVGESNAERKVSDDIKKDLRSIKNEISSELVNKGNELPDNMQDKEKSFELFKALGEGLKGVAGRYRFEPSQGENLMRTKNGVYVRGNLRLSKEDAQNMLSRAEDFTDADVPDYGDLTTNDDFKDMVSVDVKDGKEYVEIQTWLKSPTDPQSITEGFMGQISPLMSGQMKPDEIRGAKKMLVDYKNNKNAFFQELRKNAKQQNQEEE